MTAAAPVEWRGVRPARPLIFAIALVIVPLSCLLGAGVGSWQLWSLAIFLCSAAAAIDAVRGARSIRQWSLSSTEHLRWFQHRSADFPLTVAYSGTRPQRAAIYLAFPASIECQEDLISVEIAGANIARFVCTPARRGAFEVCKSGIQISSPWNLWHVTGVAALHTSIRVDPDLRKEREGNFLIARQHAGEHRFRQTGKGREFEKLREYVPGDSFEDIHWKATARRRRPVVKVFQIERTQEVYAVIDASRLSAREDLMDRYVNAALTLAIAAETQHDKFGLVSFSAGVDHFLPAASGARHFGVCRDAIYGLQSRPVTPDLEEVFSVLRTRIHKRSLIVFLTVLDDPALAEAFVRDVQVLSRSHIVLVNVPHQEEVRSLFSGNAPDDVDTVYERLAGHLEWTQLQELKRTLERRNVRLAITHPASLPAQLTRQYFEVKQRQIL